MAISAIKPIGLIVRTTPLINAQPNVIQTAPIDYIL